MFAFTAQAQTSDLPEAGLTPASSFYFVERFFEGVGTFFTFGNEAKAQRYLNLAEKRLAEARELANDGDERVEKSLERYETQLEQARERAQKISDIDLETRIIDAKSKHIDVLEDVLEKVPEQARAAIEAVRQRAIERQVSDIIDMSNRNPEKAAEVLEKASNARLQALERRANNMPDNIEQIEKHLAEVDSFADFGRELSERARALQSGDTTVEDLIEQAMMRRQEALERVMERVPEMKNRAADRTTPYLIQKREENPGSGMLNQNREISNNPNSPAQTEQVEDQAQDPDFLDPDDDGDSIPTTNERVSGEQIREERRTETEN